MPSRNSLTKCSHEMPSRNALTKLAKCSHKMPSQNVPSQNALDALVDMQMLIGDWKGEAFMDVEAANLLREATDQFLDFYTELGLLADTESLLLFRRCPNCTTSGILLGEQNSAASVAERRGSTRTLWGT